MSERHLRSLFSRASENDYGAQPTQDPCVHKLGNTVEKVRNTAEKYRTLVCTQNLQSNAIITLDACVHNLALQCNKNTFKTHLFEVFF